MTSSSLLQAGFPYLTKDDISGSIHPPANARGFLETVINLGNLYLLPINNKIKARTIEDAKSAKYDAA